MRKLQRTSLLVPLIWLGIFACALQPAPPAVPLPDDTSVAATVNFIVGATQTAAASIASPTSSMTSTPETPTLTPTATLSPTPTFTVTPLIPMISVSIPTNCRSGPGKAYGIVGALLVGETVRVYARDPSGNYWYIENPDEQGHFCWVYGGYATLSGFTGILPVFTPPPTPTPTPTSTPTLTPSPAPGFSASYSGLNFCAPVWWPEIKVKNTGTIVFRSIGITVTDTVTSESVSSTADSFIDEIACGSSTSQKTLAGGGTLTVSGPHLSADPTGHKLGARITLCSSTGLNGTCVTRNISFTP